MLSFLGRRLASMAVVLFLVLTGMFFTLHLAPGSPVNNLPPTVAADPAARAAYEARLGLDQPLLVQYGTYLRNLATGDLGESLLDGSSVADQISTRLPVSLELGLLAGLWSVLVGFGIGVASVVHRRRYTDSVTRVGTILGLSMPAYWLAVLATILVGSRFPDLLPSGAGYVRFGDDPVANLTAMLLPALVLGLSTCALVARTLRASLLDVMSSDYVTFARAMGHSRLAVVRRVGLRGALLPTLTVVGLLLGGLVSGTVLIESVFQIPGVGQLMVTAFLRKDYPLAMGLSIVTAVLFLVLNLVIDALYYVVDPRTRSALVRGKVATA